MWCIIRRKNQLRFLNDNPLVFRVKKSAKRAKEILNWDNDEIKPCKIIL